jgi:hypothetical protein
MPFEHLAFVFDDVETVAGCCLRLRIGEHR